MTRPLLFVDLGQAAGGLAILKYGRDLQFQQIAPHGLKLRHARRVCFHDMPSGIWAWSVPAQAAAMRVILK
jgi:hypothetical protein